MWPLRFAFGHGTPEMVQTELKLERFNVLHINRTAVLSVPSEPECLDVVHSLTVPPAPVSADSQTDLSYHTQDRRDHIQSKWANRFVHTCSATALSCIEEEPASHPNKPKLVWDSTQKPHAMSGLRLPLLNCFLYLKGIQSPSQAIVISSKQAVGKLIFQKGSS